MPNPWDRGSAMLLAKLGFPAIATTSAGFAWSMGRPDSGVALEEVIKHFRSITISVDVPVNADFEGGYAIAPGSVANNVTVACTTGIAGLSIEDSAPPAVREDSPLFDFELSVERIRSARDAIDASRTGVVLTARSEGFITGHPDLADTIKRLTAYAEAGADCLYSPGVKDAKDIAEIVNAVKPKPVNVLVGSNFATVDQLKELGVRRISVGGALARSAWGSVLAAAREIAEHGTFEALGGGVPFDEINALFERRAKPRPPSDAKL
jgi:methylisocitrate lyase